MAKLNPGFFSLSLPNLPQIRLCALVELSRRESAPPDLASQGPSGLPSDKTGAVRKAGNPSGTEVLSCSGNAWDPLKLPTAPRTTSQVARLM